MKPAPAGKIQRAGNTENLSYTRPSESEIKARSIRRPIHPVADCGPKHAVRYTDCSCEMSIMRRTIYKRCLAATMVAALMFASGCAKRISFNSLPLAGAAKAVVRVELTYNRNDTLEVKVSNVADPSILNPSFTRYVLWMATPDRQYITNIGQLRVDEKRRAEINTLTPFRKFILFITAEPNGEVTAPGPDILFQTPEIDW